MAKLSEAEIRDLMPRAEGWTRHGDMLVRSWRFPSARRALEFVNGIAAEADRLGHYPEIVLNFRDVRAELATHDQGGLTARDFDLAEAINALPVDR